MLPTEDAAATLATQLQQSGVGHRGGLHGTALRISAAELGGRVCVHALADTAEEVADFLRAQGWDVRCPTPSAPTQTITLA